MADVACSAFRRADGASAVLLPPFPALPMLRVAWMKRAVAVRRGDSLAVVVHDDESEGRLLHAVGPRKSGGGPENNIRLTNLCRRQRTRGI